MTPNVDGASIDWGFSTIELILYKLLFRTPYIDDAILHRFFFRDIFNRNN
jgi:hypothetical protein